MLFGFTLIVIFYYFKKINDKKNETLKVFLNFLEGQNKMLDHMIKIADVLSQVVNKFPPAV
jgi:hypothetical protein